MDSQIIRAALGKIQADPDASDEWSALNNALSQATGDLSSDDVKRLLEAARAQHIERGEWDAVARLLELSEQLAAGSENEPPLVAERARVLSEELFDDKAAAIAYRRLLEISPDDPRASAALSESEQKQARFQELVQSYADEAASAPDDVYKSSMLMRASEMELRFSGEEPQKETIERLEQAVRLDPTNERAGRMLERIYRQKEDWEGTARVLERLSDRSASVGARVAAGIRLARVYAQKLEDNERAVEAYARVLRDQPSQSEAMNFLSEYYSSQEKWDDLVALYEQELRSKDVDSPEILGEIFQIAMLHWRKRERPQDAEPWFERMRRINPSHDGVLNFFREYCTALDDDARLIEVLQAAQKSLPDDKAGKKKKAALASEIGRLAEGQANAHKAIEQYKSVLRQDPDNSEAREALKRLYKQTQGYNALVELLRQELERTPPEEYEKRLSVLRDVATVYRQYIKSDTALVSVLNQIVQLDDKLDEHDIDEVRELVVLYEKLGRWRDLLTNQQRLAELTSDVQEKKSLYRAVARRWLDQFSNVQNATEAYAALLKVEPSDLEARERLEELYRKRRAWPALYELYESELEQSEGSKRLTLLGEMAQLAAERLNRPDDAVRLYKEIMAADPERVEVLDSLEKLAERHKDWATLAEVLERRFSNLEDESSKLSLLQKLGGVYADHLGDPVKAAGAWRRVLELQPGHHRALRVLRDSYLQAGDYEALEELYGQQGDWDSLAEVLSTAADRAKDQASKIELSYRAASVYETKLNAPDRAFRSYERILATDPSDVRAARALIPLYEEDEKWVRLPALYELLLNSESDKTEQLKLLEKLVQVTGKRLSDRRSAVTYARRAYDLAPESEQALELFEDASRGAESWDSFVEALEKRLSAPAAPAAAQRRRGKRRKKEPEAASESETGLSAEEHRLLSLKLATVYADELGKVDEAVVTFKRLLEREPADVDAANTLEGILRRQDRREDLRWLLELRVEHAANDDDRAAILSDWAAMEENVFESPEKTASLYRRLLEIRPNDTTALRALPRLLLDAGDATEAVQFVEQHRDQLEGAERAQREIELAELYLNRLEEPRKALDAAVRALQLGSDDQRAIDVLERLLSVPEVKADVASVLSERYAERGDARREADALTVMLEDTKEPRERLNLFNRLILVFEQKLEAYSSALDVALQAVAERPEELELWDRAEALSIRAGRPTELAERYRDVLRGQLSPEMEIELCERAARWYEDKLGDPIGASPYLERVLALEPGNERAFVRLKDILTGAERWGELEALYDRASRSAEDPARRVEMLAEVALICEEIIEDLPKATRYYERVLESAPSHENAIRSLDRLYAQQDRKQDLARLLERRLEEATSDELLEFKLRLAKLQIELHEPEHAIHHVGDVLRERVNDYDARELAEKLLEIGSLRGRAARMLEAVYESRDEIRDLVRVLAIRLETLKQPEPEGTSRAERQIREDEQRDLLRRVSVLRDERLHDDAGALEALAELVPLDPLDADSRQRLIEVGRRVGAHEKVAAVLLEAAERADTPGLQGEILMGVAHIFEELLQDSERAEKTYRRVLGLDDGDADLVLPAARALEKIYTANQRYEELAEMLEAQVRLEDDASKRAELLGRLGELNQSMLNNKQAAIKAWLARLDESPSDEEALAALDGLYEQTEEYRKLVQVLDRRREVTDDEGLRKRLLERSAETLWKRLEVTSEAIDAYRALVDEFGPDDASLSALESLYAMAERWHDLNDTLDQHLNIVETDEQRLDLLGRQGDLRRGALNDFEGALEVYRRALSIDTGHAASRRALEEMLELEDPLVRREAAEILHPIYDADGNHAGLLRVLGIEIDTAEEPLTKLQGLENAMRVAEGPLGDAEQAFGFAERAVRSAVGHTDLGPYLEHLERLAEQTRKQSEYVKILCDVVPEIFDGDVQSSVTLKIAELARHQLGDRELAKEYYQKSLELRPDDARALVALESLYEESGEAPRLLEILERRVEVAESDEERKQLLFRRARLLSDVLEERARAIEVYEAILDLELDPQALEALEKLYQSEGLWVELIGLYQRQLEQGVGNAAELHVKVAKVAARQQNDLLRAFEELEQALEMERQEPNAIEELERLLVEAPDAESRARAASLLEPVYLVRADYSKVMETIKARLEFAEDPEERSELLTRLAQLYEEQKEDYAAALETVAQLLEDDLGDENTIAELERLAKVANARERLAEIYSQRLEAVDHDDTASAKLARRTGELFDELGNADQALLFYRRALAFEPESKSLFAAVDNILNRTGRHLDRVQLYRDALDYRYEPEDRLEVLHTIAGLQRKELGNSEAAIETYRAALEVDETNAPALDALTELYRERERFDDLAELFLSRAELATSPELAAGFRYQLARLYRDELKQPERAIDQLEEIVRSEPTHRDALKELESLRDEDIHKERVVEILRPLYESVDDWRHLIKLNEDRFELATDASEKVSVLRETAELWEQRGQDLHRARRALAQAVKLDPEDPGVREDYERLVSSTGAWDQLTETYEEILAKQPDIVSKRELLSTLIRVHDEERDDPRRALQASERLRALDETELEPLLHIERLATLLSDWIVLMQALTLKADLVLDDDERARVFRRVGETRRDMLLDPEGAIEAFERAFELDPSSTATADRLIELYEQKEEPARLVELYLQRVELAQGQDDELSYRLLLKAAECYEQDLKDPSRAIETLNQALDVKPNDLEVLRALNRLYKGEQMWSELLDNLRIEAQGAESVEERSRVRKEMGDILASKLGDYDEALEAYRSVLDEAPEDEAVAQAILSIGEEHEDLRKNVADILVPVLRTASRHQRLVEVLELRLTIETEPDQRAETLREIAAVYETDLSNPSQAEEALLRALAETPEDGALHEAIERLAQESGDWLSYAKALDDRAQNTFEPELARELFQRLGRISEEKLGDNRRAVEAYSRAVEHAGDQPELLEALDRLYESLGASQELSEILERRVVAEESEEKQAELYYRLGLLQIREFKEPARGLGSLRVALERQPEHEEATRELEKLTDERELFEEASEVLERVYRSRGQVDRLAALYEKRVGFAETAAERIDMRRDLARVLEEDSNDPAAAQKVLQAGLLDDPSDATLLEEIERLAPITQNWEGAAAALRNAIDSATDLLPGTATELCVRLSKWQRDKIEDNAAAEAALLKALEFEPENDAVLEMLEDLQRQPGRELTLVNTLRKRAKLQLDDQKREEFYRNAKELSDGQGDKQLAEEVLRELLQQDDTNLWALSELTDLRESAEDYQETFELLVKRSELRAAGDTVRQLRHRAAVIATEKLNEKQKAIELYEHLFEDEPTDKEASGALCRLYEETERWDDLARLFERLIDLTDDASERAALRIRLAKLNHERLSLTSVAIDLLHVVLEEDVGNSSAVVFLSELLEAEERDEELAELLSTQIAAAKERGDTDAELTFQVRLGEVYDVRLGQRKMAIEAYRSVLERDPQHRAALEALARLYRAESNHEKAAEILESLLELSQGEDAVRLASELADEYAALEDDAGVRRALERGAAADERNPELRDKLRSLYKRTSAWQELAELTAGDAEFTDDRREKVRLLRAAAEIHATQRKDHAAAAELLDRASQLEPDDRELLLALCDAYSASGRGKQAAEVLQKIVDSYGGKRVKELGEIHRRLADAYMAEGDTERALGELDKAFRIEPGNVSVLKQLGEVALDAGDLKKAQQMFRALLLQRLDESSPITKPQVFFRLGQVHEKLDEKPKAIQMYERALQNDDTLSEAKSRLEALRRT